MEKQQANEGESQAATFVVVSLWSNPRVQVREYQYEILTKVKVEFTQYMV